MNSGETHPNQRAIKSRHPAQRVHSITSLLRPVARKDMGLGQTGQTGQEGQLRSPVSP